MSSEPWGGTGIDAGLGIRVDGPGNPNCSKETPTTIPLDAPFTFRTGTSCGMWDSKEDLYYRINGFLDDYYLKFFGNNRQRELIETAFEEWSHHVPLKIKRDYAKESLYQIDVRLWSFKSNNATNQKLSGQAQFPSVRMAPVSNEDCDKLHKLGNENPRRLQINADKKWSDYEEWKDYYDWLFSAAGKALLVFFNPVWWKMWALAKTGLSRTDYHEIVLHEIGHALGLGHATDESVMSYKGDHLYALRARDLRAIKSLYPRRVDGPPADLFAVQAWAGVVDTVADGTDSVQVDIGANRALLAFTLITWFETTETLGSPDGDAVGADIFALGGAKLDGKFVNELDSVELDGAPTHEHWGSECGYYFRTPRRLFPKNVAGFDPSKYGEARSAAQLYDGAVASGQLLAPFDTASAVQFRLSVFDLDTQRAVSCGVALLLGFKASLVPLPGKPGSGRAGGMPEGGPPGPPGPTPGRVAPRAIVEEESHRFAFGRQIRSGADR